MRFCTSCGTAHMGLVPCGMTFAERLRSVHLGEGATPTRTRRGDYDRSAVAATFGEDSREQLLEETGGLGVAKRRGGRWVHKDRRTGEIVPVDQRGSDWLEGRDLERDYDPGLDEPGTQDDG